MNSCAILFFFSFSNRERDARHVNLIQKILQTCNFMYSRNKSLFYIFFCVSFISISSAQFYDLFESSKKVKVIFCHLREIFSKIIYNFETINFSPCLLKLFSIFLRALSILEIINSFLLFTLYIYLESQIFKFLFR